jgi:hypothetical protein
VTAPYLFGFTSSVKDIHFFHKGPTGPTGPVGLNILVVEASVQCGSQNYSYEGEAFSVSWPAPGGPAAGALVPGPIAAFRTPPATPPVGLTGPVGPPMPMSQDLQNRAFVWEVPNPAYLNIQTTSSAAATVAVFDIGNLNTALGPSGTTGPSGPFVVTVKTSSHGSSTPPSPTPTWFWYYDPYNFSLVEAATINPTEDFNTQSFLDITENLSGGGYYITDRVAAANPFAVADYGTRLDQICCMYSYVGIFEGYPGMPTAYPNGFTTQGEAQAWVDYMSSNDGSVGPPPYPSGVGWPPSRPIVNGSAAIGVFPWMTSPSPPPGTAACSWNLRVSSWRGAKTFKVSSHGVFTPGATGQVQVGSVNSGGPNPPAETVTISVLPATMKFTLNQS